MTIAATAAYSTETRQRFKPLLDDLRARFTGWSTVLQRFFRTASTIFRTLFAAFRKATRLRDRHLLTRDNRLRVRFVVMFVAAAGTLFSSFYLAGTLQMIEPAKASFPGQQAGAALAGADNAGYESGFESGYESGPTKKTAAVLEAAQRVDFIEPGNKTGTTVRAAGDAIYPALKPAAGMRIASSISPSISSGSLQDTGQGTASDQGVNARNAGVNGEGERQSAQHSSQSVGNAAARTISKLLDSRLYGKLSLASASLPQLPEPKHTQLKVRSGDTLGTVMKRAGVKGSEAHKAVSALSRHFDPRRLQPGQMIHVRFDPVEPKQDSDAIPLSEEAGQNASEGEGYIFADMKIEIDPISSVLVSRVGQGGSFIAQKEEKPVMRKVYASEADISVSLYGSAEKRGIPRGVISDVIKIYSWDVDFQRDIRPGDKLEIMYDRYETEDGYVARTGDVIYARLTVGGVGKPVYRYELADNRVDYFGPDGKSVRKALMKTPVDGGRLSSGYGMRRHPVLGYSKMHKGVDFSAPRGTPIYAAGDGVIERASRYSSYGNYVRIRHNSSLKTAYAHLHKFGKGISAGKRIKQGQIIGYVGTTGRSTGPHLHYEVLKNGRQVNPRSLKLPTGEVLQGKALVAFKKAIQQMDRDYASLRDGVKFAQKTNRPGKNRYN